MTHHNPAPTNSQPNYYQNPPTRCINNNDGYYSRPRTQSIQEPAFSSYDSSASPPSQLAPNNGYITDSNPNINSTLSNYQPNRNTNNSPSTSTPTSNNRLEDAY